MPSDYGRVSQPARRTTAGIGVNRGPYAPPAAPQMPAGIPGMPGGGQAVQNAPLPGQEAHTPGAPAPSPAAPAAAPVAPPMPALTNTATPSPQLQQADASYQARLAQLQQPRGTDSNQQFLIDKYRERLSADNTQGLIDREQLRIADAASARKAGLTNESGRMGAGAGGRDIGRIDSAANRAMAASADNIRLGREQQLDALTLGGTGIMNAPANMELAREGALNQFTLQGLPYAQSQANLGLAQQGLGLQQWNAQANYGLGAAGLQQAGNIAAQNAEIERARLAQQAQAQQNGYWLSLLQASGY